MADHGDYVPGSMDIEEQKATFGLFWSLTKWGSVAVGIFMVILALTRTNAIDCKNAEQAAAHINACGKLPASGEAGEH
ncbi:MAG: aa3-type cytochrome c oxidase subunit IV [Alphaproteobacteria bacterium]|jgi:hypothetical protein